MSTIGEIAVNAVVRTEGATKGTREFRTEVRGMSTASMAASAGVAALGTAAVTAGYKIFSLVQEQGALADAIDHSTQRVGLSVENLSRYRYAADLAAGVTGGALDGAIQRMNTNVSMASQGLGKAGKAIKELGLDAKYLSTLDTDRKMGAIAEAISHVSSAADKTRLTEKIFGTGDLMPMLKDGAAGLAKLAEESDRVGATLNTLANEKLGAADDAMDRYHASVAGAKHALGSLFAPAIAAVADELTETIALMRDSDYLLHSQEAAYKREAAAVTAAAAAHKKYNEERFKQAGSAANTVDLSYRKREFEQLQQEKKALQDRINETRTGNETFGMSDVDAAKHHLSNRMTDRALETQLIKELEIRERLTKEREAGMAAQERENQLKERAAQIIEQNLTPLEELKKRLTEIQELHKAGKLTDEQAERATKNAREGFKPGGETAERRPALAAIKFGSVEAVRAINESKHGNELKKLSAEQLVEQKKANELAEQTNAILKGDVFAVAAWS